MARAEAPPSNGASVRERPSRPGGGRGRALGRCGAALQRREDKICVEIGVALSSIWFEEPQHVDCESYLRAGAMYLHRACTLDASTCKELVAFGKVLERAHAFEWRADVLDEACTAGYEPACRLLASRDEKEEKRLIDDHDDAFLCGPSPRARKRRPAP